MPCQPMAKMLMAAAKGNFSQKKKADLRVVVYILVIYQAFTGLPQAQPHTARNKRKDTGDTREDQNDIGRPPGCHNCGHGWPNT